MRKLIITILVSATMTISSMGTAHAQFELIMAQLLQQSTNAASSSSSSPGQSAVTNVTNQMATFKYEFHNGFTPYSPSEMLSRKAGDCKDMATYFTDTLSQMGLNTERVAENYSSPSGSGGHTIGIATDGVHAWLSTNQTVQMFNSVDAALANGGVARLPSGSTISGQVVYGGQYVAGQQLKAAGQ